MRIFISHPIDDTSLAMMLKETLESDKKIEEAYIAVKTPEYQLDIPEKIINQIKNSDYLIAIMTTNTFQSASVHQEIGYAQGIDKPRIPLIEKSAKAGFLHDSKDRIEFDRMNFKDACKQALDYVIKHGPTRNAYSEQDKIIATKSAHFRYELEQELSRFMGGILAYYNIKPNDEQIFFDEKGREYAHQIIENFTKEQEKMYEKIGKLELTNLAKIHSDYTLLQRGIEDAKRFPYATLFEDEEDAFFKLTERIDQVSNFSIDILKYLQETLQISDVDHDTTFEKIITNHRELVSLPRYLMSYVHDIVILTRAVIDLDQILLKIRKKFGNIAFKNTYDKDSV